MMPRDRFLEIKKFLYFTSEMQDQTDPLSKIRPFYDTILKACKENWISTQNVSIDESVISFTGRHSGVVYMPRKPIKNGFKIYVLADYLSYVVNFIPSFCFSNKEHNVKNIVWNLVEDYGFKGYHLFMDR